MDTNTNNNDNLFGLSIDDTARNLLKSIATWARIVAIIGLCGAALSIADAFLGGRGNSMTMLSSVLVTAILVVFFVILNIILLRFSSSMKAGLQGMDQAQFNQGVSNMALYWKLMGIFIIVVMALIVIGIMAMAFFMGMR